MSRLVSSVGYVALSVASFAGVAQLQQPLVPWPEGFGLPAKMEYFVRHKDEFDVLYVGTSRFVRGVDNKLIDERLAERGIEVRSFNLAVGGMGSFEQDYLLHWALSHRPARLKWIFYEGGPIGMGVRDDHIFRNPDNTWSEREVYWHTPVETWRVLGAIARLPVTTWRKLELALTHVQLFGWKFVNYGRGGSFLRERRKSAHELGQWNDTMAELEQARGHQGLETATKGRNSRERKELLSDPAAFEARMAAIPAENRASVPLEEVNLELYRAQFRDAQAHGARLVYVVAPQYESSPERLRLHEAGVIPELLNYNDPERYPELFRIENRFDKGHLNRQGVILFSERLARDIGDLIEAERGGI